ncbi:transporter substrate-binding domain-containing protein [Lewinella sp. JB7]|uniref:transporter substrate-binding domain-containing protein n=1 Tax=Lewinella sp. JB7 TaxID=2962887 RepID=UPI0020C9CE82|nr:transporter substrate-binding domain-containing protein [Lewinella sp. JB7]MCP9236134.1 transporter substrate-binding domain-containing protein [Lewinella sp. JB7]
MRFCFVLPLLVLLLIFGCDIPRDPAGSFARAQREALRVGITDNPPFVIISDDDLHGTEITIVEEFAGANGMDIRYVMGSESSLVRQLERRELDVVIGGLEKTSVWTREVGASVPYDGRHVFLIPRGENKLLYHLESTLRKPRS